MAKEFFGIPTLPDPFEEIVEIFNDIHKSDPYGDFVRLLRTRVNVTPVMHRHFKDEVYDDGVSAHLSVWGLISHLLEKTTGRRIAAITPGDYDHTVLGFQEYKPET